MKVLPRLHSARHAPESRDRRRRRVQRLRTRTRPSAGSIGRRAKTRSSDVVAQAKARSRGYDCLIPVSGGKDSTWQVVKCLEYGPEAACGHLEDRRAAPRIGQRNLDNLDLARRRSHRLQHQPRGRAQVHAPGVRTLRVDRDSDAHGDLQHPAAHRGAVRHSAGRVGRELGIRVRRRATRSGQASGSTAPGSRRHGVTHGTTARGLDFAEDSASRN